MIIPGGVADLPVKELDGLTPLCVAETPTMDAIAAEGRLGLVSTVPQACEAEDHIALLTLLGFDIQACTPGRGVLLAASRSIPIHAGDWVFCLDFVTTEYNDSGDVVGYYPSGAVTEAESRLLLESLAEGISNSKDDTFASIEFLPGPNSCCILIDRAGDADRNREYQNMETCAPFCIEPPTAGRRFALLSLFPQSDTMPESLRFILEMSNEVFHGHDVNLTRRELGEHEVSQIWLWGEGRIETEDDEVALVSPQMIGIPCESLRKLKGRMLTTDHIAAGIADLVGWDTHTLAPDQYQNNIDDETADSADTEDTAVPDTLFDQPKKYTEAIHYRSSDWMQNILQTISQSLCDDLKSMATPHQKDTKDHTTTCNANEWDIACVYLTAPGKAAEVGDFASKIDAITMIDHELIQPVKETLDTLYQDQYRLLIVPERCIASSTNDRSGINIPFALCGAGISSVIEFNSFTEEEAIETDLRIEQGHHLMEYFIKSAIQHIQ